MIKKYVYGSPLQTDAVQEETEVSVGEIPHLKVSMEAEKPHISYRMDKDDIVYGLGENVRGINKRGYIYESFCSDDPYHTEEKRSLYGAHNFIVISGRETFGVFVDIPSSVTFDIGYTDHDMLSIKPSEENFVLYIIEGGSVYEIVRSFRRMIGRSYIAPRWAFGYQQSRWSYYTADDIREVVRNYRTEEIPLDAVYMDIDYMEDYKDFTVSEERFPEFEKFVLEMRDQGIRLVPIIDAGVKIEDGYDIYEEGIEGGHFCKRADGTEFVAGVWPGRTHFPDFLRKETREWFGEKYKRLLDKGIDGFWNDMNEPAMFYTDEGIEEGKELIKSFDFENSTTNDFFSLRDKLSGLANRREDYARFYHSTDSGSICHSRVHNLYGYNMTRAAGEAFERLSPDKRILLFSRSSYIGMHRYGGIWTGDNQSWWSHLLLNIKMMPSLNMCGFLYSGADLGGFGSHCTRELLLRWLAFGVFTPLMRNHTAFGTRDQECYRFGDTEAFRNIISVRYSLIPYLYSEYMKACLDYDMMIKPLGFEYPDDSRACRVEDQLIVGESIMIAPVYEQNARGRYVYLPEDMLFVRFKSAGNREYRVMSSGTHYIDVPEDEVPLFIRKGHILPLCAPAQCTDRLNTQQLELIAYTDSVAEYILYDDDGLTTQYDMAGDRSVIRVERVGKGHIASADREIVKVYTAG